MGNTIKKQKKTSSFAELASNLITNKKIIKALCKKDIIFFGKIFFKDFKIFPHQVKWIENLKYKKHLQLSPRDHGKSKIFTEIFPIWAICNVPDVRILIASKSLKQSMKFLKDVKEQLLYNKKLLAVYGDVYMPDDMNAWTQRKGTWTETQIYVKRSEGASMRDPTIEAIGVLGSITGSHFDYMIIDDPIDDENTKTLSRRESVNNWFFGTIGQLAEPTTHTYVIGTRKHWDDLYDKILDNAIWHKTIDKAIIKYPNNWEAHFRNPTAYPERDFYIKDKEGLVVDVEVTGTWEVLAPLLWDIKTLLLDRLGSTPPYFEREKQNNPTLMRGQEFDIDWLRYYDTLPTDDYQYYQGVDVAVSETLRADYFVDITVAVNKMNDVYIIGYYRTKTKFPKQLKIVKTQADIYQVRQIVMETNSYQAALKQQLLHDTILPITGVSHTGVSKEYRIITTLSPVFEAGKIFIKKDMTDLKKEYLGFPRIAHDDILDALEMVIKYIMKKQPLVFSYRLGKKFETSKNKSIFLRDIPKGRRVFK